ncbi:BTAD domain-containing putative transcriptional regulator [Streptomyces sp. NPDC059651]|uniref:AfsR/SARP family transcriptional regulator n=1 Tax=Streptomyces sp. NPDC059651 TaxID=3346897 RepID=UPI00368BCED5
MKADVSKELRFNLLGPLEAWAGDTCLHFNGQIQQRVLAALLLERGRLLPVSRLVEAAWEEVPPATAAHQVRKAVADLRQRIPQGDQLLLTNGPGYSAALEPDSLDLDRFDRGIMEARAATAQGDQRSAVRLLASALQLWRGPALSGLGGHVLNAAALVLEERHLAAVERYFALRLALGESVELVSELRAYTGRHPLRETLQGHLLVALSRSGRRAEALEEFQRLRRRLAEELGVDPSPRLSEVHQRILRDSFAPTPSLRPPASTTITTPSTLPPGLGDFVGREQEVHRILAMARASGLMTTLIAVDGMGGGGKTSLAVHAAHLLGPDYPDGQLFLDLRGYSPGERPVGAGVALKSLLCVLGIPQESIPEDALSRAALWRSTLAGKRLLLLLDNAADAGVVSQLIPPSPGCLVLVTSRSRLIDLDGARWLSLDVFTSAESEKLIGAVLGPRRTAAETSATAEMARLCGHLPLALRIATARLSNRPHWTLSEMVGRLRDEERRLYELCSGERGVVTTLSLSYQGLTVRGQQSFRMLALHPGPDTDVHSAAALLGMDPWRAEEQLERLLDVRLLEQCGTGRYAFHDLVRSFAHSLPGGRGTTEGDAAVRRLLSYYLSTTETACDVLFPGRAVRLTRIEPSAARMPDLSSATQVRSWFAHEITALTSAVHTAARDGHDRHAVSLGRNVAFYLNSRGRLEEFVEISRTVVATARKVHDPALLAVSLSNLGVACWKLGLHEEGLAASREGLELAVTAGDKHTEAHCEGTLGLYKSLFGCFGEALAHLQRAVATEHELGAVRAKAESLTVLSALSEQWGLYPEAAKAAQEAVELVRQLGRHETELVALTDLALARAGLGEYTSAEEVLVEARSLPNGASEPGQVAMVLAVSALVALGLRDGQRAACYADRAQNLIKNSLSPLRQAKVGNLLGLVQIQRGLPSAALRLYTSAYDHARRVTYRVEEANALDGMARAAEALGKTSQAFAHRNSAEALYAKLDLPASRNSRMWLGGHH